MTARKLTSSKLPLSSAGAGAGPCSVGALPSAAASVAAPCSRLAGSQSPSGAGGRSASAAAEAAGLPYSRGATKASRVAAAAVSSAAGAASIIIAARGAAAAVSEMICQSSATLCAARLPSSCASHLRPA